MTFTEETLESEKIYEGAILNVRKDIVTVKDGNTSFREIVEHNGGAAVVAIKDDGKVVMVKQFRKPFERVMLEIPAGKTEEGEDPRETVIRELKEETGYTAENVELLCKYAPSVGYLTEVLYIYKATGLTPGETNFDPQEAIDQVELPLEEVVEMIKAGDIVDGKTMTGILLTNQLR